MIRWHTILPLVQKDLRLYFGNRFYAFITALSLAAVIIAYALMPDTVDETFRLAMYAPGVPSSVLAAMEAEEEGLEIVRAGTEQDLSALVLAEEAVAGLAVPPSLGDPAAEPTITLYLLSSTETEMRDMLRVLTRGIAITLSGAAPDLAVSSEILGADRGGNQIPTRDRMRPLFAVLVVMLEVLGTASLLTEEIESGTIRAILTTPLSTRELYVAKGATGLILSFTQGAIVMACVGGLSHQPLLMLLTLAEAALLVTAVGFLISASTRDMLSTMGVGMVALILLSIPPFGVLFPGLISGWGRALPSHYVASAVHELANLGGGWAQVRAPLAILLGYDIVLGGLGILVTQRRFQ